MSPLEPLAGNARCELVRDFSQCNARLWDDKLGQISLATTTLFWGVTATTCATWCWPGLHCRTGLLDITACHGRCC